MEGASGGHLHEPLARQAAEPCRKASADPAPPLFDAVGSITGSGVDGLPGRDHRCVIISVVYLVVRCLLGCLMMLTQRQVSKDAELLVLGYENAVLRRQICQVRYQPGAALA